MICAGVARLPLSQSSECTSRTGLSAGQHDARNRPGAKVTNLYSREPLSLHQPGSPDDVLHVSEIDSNVSETETNVKDYLSYGDSPAESPSMIKSMRRRRDGCEPDFDR